MKKLIIPVLVILLGAGYYFWSKGQSNTERQVAKIPEPKLAIDRFPVEDSLDEVVEGEASAMDEPLEEVENILWEESELAKQVLHENGRLPKDLKGETYLELNVDMLRNLEIGEYVDMDLPGVEGDYDAQVGSIQQHASGNKSLELNFPGHARLFGATITLGKDVVYAQLNLPSGSYTMEAQDGFAWIAPNGALIQGHVENGDLRRKPSSQGKKLEGGDLLVEDEL
ncbi:hypothetical protein MJO52_08430 [Microbulbifer variabilis]|uniref:LPS export ABC transporter periplasmic protein LptC n=1 Tax=Microbulbifer variabilis TaxID=266805 RepID=A0ABY4VFR9_9GAMM|nr:hypothetical protein [Microbulbifer variabilis]USD23148.1 hypothetical protein MJO52_08430 [Microbulbifer variabilis]